MRTLLIRYYDIHRAYELRFKPDPLDKQYGIATVGSIPGYALVDGSSVPNTTGYDVAPAEIIRSCLALVTEPANTTLLDLGCGKGRVLAVGSEFPFREIVGIELSDVLAAVAEANVRIVRAKFPERCPLRVVAGDAVEYPLPDGRLTIFLFNPFGEAQVRRLLARIERALEERGQALTIIYANPVWGAILDASPWLVREYALDVPFKDEIATTRPAQMAVVIWRDRRHPADAPALDALRPIVVIDRHHAALATIGAPV